MRGCSRYSRLNKDYSLKNTWHDLATSGSQVDCSLHLVCSSSSLVNSNKYSSWYELQVDVLAGLDSHLEDCDSTELVHGPSLLLGVSHNPQRVCDELVSDSDPDIWWLRCNGHRWQGSWKEDTGLTPSRQSSQTHCFISAVLMRSNPDKSLTISSNWDRLGPARRTSRSSLDFD